METEKKLKEEIGEVVRDVVRAEIRLFRAEVNTRFDGVDKSLGRLEIMVNEMDDKFSLITEGQDIIRDVLETRVAHIEEVLGVETRV